MMSEADSLLTQLSLFDKYELQQMGYTQDSLSGKMFQVLSPATTGLTFEQSLNTSQRAKFQYLGMEDGQTQDWFNAERVTLHGASLTLNIGECPNDERIFLVADFGATGRCVDKILFESQVVPINSEKSAKEEERASFGAAKSARVSSPMGFNPNAGVIDSMPVLCDKVPTMKAVTRLAICAYSFDALESNSMKSKNPHSGCRIVDIARTLDTSTPDPAKNQGGIAVMERKLYGYVRRLTPLECERLQGLPDNWTLIDDKSCSDTARYRAIGNGMAQPCADYVLQRIVDVANGQK